VASLAVAAQLVKIPNGPLNRELLVLDAATVADATEAVPPATGHFAVFLAWDALSASTDAISELAVELHNRGLAYLCAWGPGCERVHDIFDEVEVQLEASRPADSVVMTTWHAEDTIEDALWFFLYNSFPDPAYQDSCSRGVALAIGNSEWANRIARYVNDLKALNSAVGA